MTGEEWLREHEPHGPIYCFTPGPLGSGLVLRCGSQEDDTVGCGATFALPPLPAKEPDRYGWPGEEDA